MSSSESDNGRCQVQSLIWYVSSSESDMISVEF